MRTDALANGQRKAGGATAKYEHVRTAGDGSVSP